MRRNISYAKNLLSVVLLIVVAVCIAVLLTFPEKEREEARACIEKCREALAADADLDNGPCLANPLTNYPNWVCDVAHQPREDVDNLAENQCSAYGRVAKHFVEVDPSCRIIRIR